MKQKAFFINSEGLSLNQIKKFFLEGESPTLIEANLVCKKNLDFVQGFIFCLFCLNL